MSEATTEVVELDSAAVDQIVEKTSAAVIDAAKEGIKEDVDTAVKAAIEEASKSIIDQYLENTEEIERKAVEKARAEEAKEDPIARGIESGDFSQEIADMSPAMRFFMAARSLDPETGSTKLLRQLNKHALATQLEARAKVLNEKGFDAAEKTGYANETTAADGAVLIPDAEFVTTVFDNLPSYGVAFRYADVRQTDRTSVRVLSLDQGLTFYSTAEAGTKTGAKLAFAKNEVSLQKYAVIVPSTDELSDDAAIDYWNLVTRELTRAYARKADEVVFTDERTGGSAGTSGERAGIINLNGVVTKAIAGSTPTWDDLLNTEAKLEDDIDTSNYKWFIRKETWYQLVQTRASSGFASADGQGLYLAGSLAEGWQHNINQPTTPWGTPVVFTRVLATATSVGVNDAFAVFGDLSNTLLYNKRGMALKMLTEATVVDSEGSNLNLATQDASAMRAVIRMLHICPKGNRARFGVLGKGTVS
jgi:HK97 family phage major capsid protein